MKNKGLIGGITLGVIIVLSLVVLALSTVKVPAGYCGVVYSVSGGVQDGVLSQGWHVITPTKHVTLYTIGIEQSYLTAGKQGDSKDDESFTASSSEGKAITIDMTFTYQFNVENVSDIFTRFKGADGKSVRDSFIKPNIISWTKEVIARYNVADIIGAERANINNALSDYLADKFSPYGIVISNASLINIEVDEETQNAINEKITATQQQATQSILNQTAIDKAVADATVQTTTAQAEADALLIAANAQAEANTLLAESLTPELIESQKIDKWNGTVPAVQGSGMTGIFDASDVVNAVQ